MGKQLSKLATTVAVLLLAAVMVIVSSYAWLTMSASPVVDGIQITIGGGNTILLAPDICVETGGRTYHYPGSFSKGTLKLSDCINPQSLCGLTPVSTADGLNWFLPSYFTSEDDRVAAHTAQVGTLKPVSEFQLDKTLQYANMAAGEDTTQGSYLYVDFWVVSPGVNYDLRVSTSKDPGVGSYVLDLQDVIESEGENGVVHYTLQNSRQSAASYLRIGFLANADDADADTYSKYANSPGASGQYKRLRGLYQEKGESADTVEGLLNSFYIYEPNGDLHVCDETLGGCYVITQPVGYVGDEVSSVNIRDRLSVQLKNQWADNAQAALETATIGRTFESPEEAQEYFYHYFLQGQTATYVDKGLFINDTSELYAASYSEVVSEEDLASLDKKGACESAIIVKLTQNVPQRIRMFVWLEGADIDCIDGVSVNNISLSLELAGSNQ